MVLRIKAPALKTLNPWIESLLAKRYKYKQYALDRYLTLEEVIVLTGLTHIEIRRTLTVSSTIHGIEVNKSLLLHPTAVFLLRKYALKKVIKKELKVTSLPKPKFKTPSFAKNPYSLRGILELD